MNLKTNYLGISLPHPLIIGSSSLTNDLDTVRELEDEGAAALVLRSLYEEEITGEQMDAFLHSGTYDDSSAEAESYFAAPELALGPDEYLEHVQRLKRAVEIPVIASLCGTSTCSWVSYARQIEQAGADALELDLYHSASDALTGAAEVEGQMIEVVREVKQGISIPVAAKLSPLFTAFANFAGRLDAAGVDGWISMSLSSKSSAQWSCLTRQSCSYDSEAQQFSPAESKHQSQSAAEFTRLSMW